MWFCVRRPERGLFLWLVYLFSLVYFVSIGFGHFLQRCSLPLGVLRNIELDPPFSGLQAEALENIESQAITQFYFAHRSKFWEKDGFAPSMFTDGPAGMVSATRSGENPAEVTGLTAWAMGLKAEKLDTLPAKKAGRLALQAIETIRPASRGQLELVGAHSWGTDPFAQGG